MKNEEQNYLNDLEEHMTLISHNRENHHDLEEQSDLSDLGEQRTLIMVLEEEMILIMILKRKLKN